MSQQQQSPTPFRNRLLDAQPMTPQLRDEYRKELEGLMVHKLSPRARLVNGLLVLVWIALAGACVYAAIVHRDSPKSTVDWWINLAMYFAVFVTLTIGGLRNAITGRHTWKAYFNVAGMFFTAAGVTVTMVLLRGLRAPQDPASTFGAIFALVFLIVSLGWALQNRIDAARMDAREHALRLEYRLAELMERLPPRG